ncbi:MAG: response regulator [Lewinellaceae bacterium]|nr:response regulator [Lewinellaceae bacterium]
MNNNNYYRNLWKTTPETIRFALFAAFQLALAWQLCFGQGIPEQENLKFIRVSDQAGLKDRAFLDIFQDSYGFIWFATDYGFFRFDGYEYSPYYTMPGDTNSISSNSAGIRAFQEDADSNLWVATYQGGLNKFIRSKEQFQRVGFCKALASNNISSILNDGQGGLWAGTMNKGLLHYCPTRQPAVKRVYPDERVIDSLPAINTVISLCQDQQGRLWIGQANGLCVYGPGKGPLYYFQPGTSPESLAGGYVTDIYQDRSGRIWVATNKGLNLWQEATHTFIRYFPNEASGLGSPQFNYIWKTYEDSHGNFWIGTNAGLLRFNVDSSRFECFVYRPADPYSISGGAVHAILEDRAGNIWFGAHNGVSMLNPSTRFFNPKEFASVQAALPSITQPQGVIAILEISGAYWIATQKGLFICKTGLPVQQVLAGDFSALYQDSQGKVYAGTAGDGFYMLDAQNPAVFSHIERAFQTPYDTSKLVGYRVFDFAEGHKGDIWIATNGALNRFNPDDGMMWQYYHIDSLLCSISNTTNKALELDKRGNLWIASNEGLNMLSRAELDKPLGASLNFIHFQYDAGNSNSISNNCVSAIHEDSQGRLWIGTEIGLNCYAPDQNCWKRYFTTDGLPDNRIAAILEDDGGYLWVATAKNGLSRFSPADGRFYNFTEKDGLNSELFNENACLKTKTGLLVFAVKNGLNAFCPKQIVPSSRQYPLYITGFELYNEPAPIGGEDAILQQAAYQTRSITLPFRQKVFSFKVAALNYLKPEKQRYRYKLQNFDKEWREPGVSREITFTNLFPGRYTLIVESTDAAQGWENSSRVLLSIHIRHPWWLCWWALLLYSLVISSGIYGLLLFRVRQARQQAENEHLRKLDEAKNRMYAYIVHQFREPLGIILGLAGQFWGNVSKGLEKNLGIIQENGLYLSSLVGQILDLSHVRSGAMPVNMVQGDIILFLKYIFESFHSYAEAKGINMAFAAEPAHYVIDYDPDKLRKILSNLLSNALKFTTVKGRVALAVRELQTGEAPMLEIAVSDNGIGIPEGQLNLVFEPFRQADNMLSRQGIGSGIGLALARELVTLLGGSIRVQSALGKGTRFIVTLPVKREATTAESIDRGLIIQAVKKGVGLITGHKPGPEREPVPQPAAGHKPLLLLIEDNPSVSIYLSQHLQKEYHLLTATDGAHGLELAQKQTPDIIISDVMMPEMDGYELCRQLRKDPATSHIPAILLTASAGLDAKVQGLQAGADDFLSKPVHLRELSVRLANLLSLRKILQERYRSPEFWKNKVGAAAPTPPPSRLSAEDEFLRKLQAVIEANIADPKLDIKKLQKKAGMSSSNIHRKLKALTGMYTTEFVRYIRLTRASELLCEHPRRNVAEVYAEVGFSSQSYFTRKFREVFGCTPKEYQERR